MDDFIQKHSALITGILSGFDRIVFRGTLRQLAYTDGMKSYLSASGILLKDFAGHVAAVTTRVRKAATSIADKSARPLVYLDTPGTSKQDAARQIMSDDRIKSGLVCVFTAVEPCVSYDIFRDRQAQLLVLRSRKRKCLHVYHYWLHPVFGFMNARIQTWFPFNIQICMNGREWLARQMDKTGIGYVRRDNCFPHIDRIDRAQNLMDKQLETAWPETLGRFARKLNPEHRRIFSSFNSTYYWTVHQSEWATDIMFENRTVLDELYPSLVHHGMTTFQSPDVMRFLGKKLPSSGNIHGKYSGEVVSDVKTRHEGVRIKHRAQGNSIKAYNKEGNILRIETTINEPAGFKVCRPRQDGDQRCLDWLPMRRGVADLKRRVDVSQAANERYIEAMACVDPTTPVGDLVAGILRHAFWKGSRFRAINPLSGEDADLLEAVVRGEFTINGFRNRDIRALLHAGPAGSVAGERRRSARMSRRLRMLRAHGLVKKVPRTHRYQVTARGRVIISAVIAARSASAEKLTALAA